MDNFVSGSFEWQSLLTPVRICHTAKRVYGQTTRTYRTLRVFGVRIAQWDTSTSEDQL